MIERLLVDKVFPHLMDEGFIEYLRKQGDMLGEADNVEDIQYCLRGQRFDCKKLSLEFVYDTGLERHEELKESGEIPRLPAPSCTFEFADLAVLATESGEWHGAPLDDEFIRLTSAEMDKACLAAGGKHYETVEAYVLPFDGSSNLDQGIRFESKPLYDENVILDVDIGEYRPFICWNATDETEPIMHRGSILLLGVLTLMEERLLDERLVSPKESTNAKRERKGKSQISAYRVLTLNLAETKRRVRRNVLRAHESPRIHWRRGHWRTIHRLSEFERRTWVKRCLVGDASKGFVEKHYRLVYQSTMH